MTRYSPRRITIPQIPAAGGGGNVNVVYDTIRATLLAATFDGYQAWELYDTVTARDQVFRSRGDRTLMGGLGDADIFIRMTIDSTIPVTYVAIRAYSDWSTLSSTGRRPSPSNETQFVVVSDTEATDIYFGLNQYEWFCITRPSAASSGYLLAGAPRRTAIPATMGGVTRLSAAVVASGAPVDLPVRSDLRNQIRPGQEIWGIDITPPGAALVADHVERMTVSSDLDAVGSNYIRVLAVAANFGIDALIGLYPQPTAVSGSHGTGNGSRCNMVHRADATYVDLSQYAYVLPPGNVVADVNGEWGITQLGVPFVYIISGPFQLVGQWDSIAHFRDDSGIALVEHDLWFPNDNAQGGYRIGRLNNAIYRFAANHYYAWYYGST